MDIESLQKEIEAKYGEQIRSMGGEISINIREKPPTDTELTILKTSIRYLGKIGKYFIWLSKTSFKVVIVYVTLMSIPQAQKNHKIYFPKSYEKLSSLKEQLTMQFENSWFKDSPHKEGSQEGQGYVIVKDSWFGNPDTFKDDKNKFSTGHIDLVITDETVSVPVSCSRYFPNDDLWIA